MGKKAHQYDVVIEQDETSAEGPAVDQDAMTQLQNNIMEMPPESHECIKQAIGVENFEKVMQGKSPETPLTPEILQGCYSQGVLEKEQKEMANKTIPEGEGDEDGMVGVQ